MLLLAYSCRISSASLCLSRSSTSRPFYAEADRSIKYHGGVWYNYRHSRSPRISLMLDQSERPIECVLNCSSQPFGSAQYSLTLFVEQQREDFSAHFLCRRFHLPGVLCLSNHLAILA
ncbi:hypothetical protein RRG08_020273 [Elysia crispata]|uniref:Uncharacterized protein n=1 Tax=Elysia crispata TaxID=231223 RepID=A0AAE0YYF2_9GAST|nr:hypothetical protein RRG08_020273 [Elysia crispata]